MNKAIKTRWVRALRSGKYKQGTGQLRTADNKFCCLGVLTDLYIKHDPSGGGWSERNVSKGGYEYEGEGDVLPARVRDWAGLGEVIPTCKTLEGVDTDLATLNDGHGSTVKRARSFARIADLIEAQF